MLRVCFRKYFYSNNFPAQIVHALKKDTPREIPLKLTFFYYVKHKLKTFFKLKKYVFLCIMKHDSFYPHAIITHTLILLLELMHQIALIKAQLWPL